MQKNKRLNFSSDEIWDLSLPSIIIDLVLFFFLIISGLFFTSDLASKSVQLITGTLGISYIVLWKIFIHPNMNKKLTFSWVFPLLQGIFIGLVYSASPYLPANFNHMLFLSIMISVPIFYGRIQSYAALLIALCTFIGVDLLFHLNSFISNWPYLIFIFVISVTIIETINKLSIQILDQINRLDILNKVSQSISSSLEIHQVLALVSSAIQSAMDADTYYVGLCGENNHLHMELFYDDGEFFPPIDVPVEGTISGWLIKNRKSIILQNAPEELPQYGIGTYIVGNQKASLSWLGAPLETGGQIIGIIAVASYKKNTFKPRDLELIENIAQKAAMAIDNANHHAKVEKKSQEDSLTEVYNHGSFLRVLEAEAADALVFQTPISLIMLDIDYFKRYNDSYGHLIGDQVLVILAQTIKQHIKRSDMVGRWGGEEFVIALPKTGMDQAVIVAERIRTTMNELIITASTGQSIQAPTVSQGVAEFPSEAKDIYSLIDIADRRLYVAKSRGRNQIEFKLDPSQSTDLEYRVIENRIEMNNQDFKPQY